MTHFFAEGAQLAQPADDLHELEHQYRERAAETLTKEER